MSLQNEIKIIDLIQEAYYDICYMSDSIAQVVELGNKESGYGAMNILSDCENKLKNILEILTDRKAS